MDKHSMVLRCLCTSNKIIGSDDERNCWLFIWCPGGTSLSRVLRTAYWSLVLGLIQAFSQLICVLRSQTLLFLPLHPPPPPPHLLPLPLPSTFLPSLYPSPYPFPLSLLPLPSLSPFPSPPPLFSSPSLAVWHRFLHFGQVPASCSSLLHDAWPQWHGMPPHNL